MVIAGANIPDFKLLEATLEAIVIERPEPSEAAPQHLCLDKGYDKDPVREVLERHGYIPHIRRIGEEKKERNDTRLEDGWWSAHWAGSRNAAPFWCATRRRPPTTWG